MLIFNLSVIYLKSPKYIGQESIKNSYINHTTTPAKWNTETITGTAHFFAATLLSSQIALAHLQARASLSNLLAQPNKLHWLDGKGGLQDLTDYVLFLLLSCNFVHINLTITGKAKWSNNRLQVIVEGILFFFHLYRRLHTFHNQPFGCSKYCPSQDTCCGCKSKSDTNYDISL